MRRHEREITDRTEIDRIIRESRAGRLGMCDDGRPYVVPLCFGYDGAAFYFHCAQEGRKIDALRKNPHVCVEFDRPMEVSGGEKPCSWGIRYESVIAFGTATPVEDLDEKKQALAHLMAQYAGPDKTFNYEDAPLDGTAVFRIDIERITGKASK